jgi:hypothetical protein
MVEIHKSKENDEDVVRVSSAVGKQLAEEEKKMLGPDQIFRYRICYISKNLHKFK